MTFARRPFPLRQTVTALVEERAFPLGMRTLFPAFLRQKPFMAIIAMKGKVDA